MVTTGIRIPRLDRRIGQLLGESAPGLTLMNLGSLLLLAFAYWAAARLSLNLALVRGQVTPIWPPTGIALVSVLLLGRRAAVPVFIAAFAVNLPLGPSPLAAAAIAAGNTVAPLASAGLMRRTGFSTGLGRLRDAVALIALGALAGMVISATGGSLTLLFSGAIGGNRFWPTWAVWWTGDAMGVLLVAPFLLSLLPNHDLPRRTWRDTIELEVLLLGTALAAYALFQSSLSLEYLVFPLIMVSAWRFRLRGAAPAALITSLVAIWAAIHGTGPFTNHNLTERMATLQIFNVTLAFASFVLAAFVEDRARRQELTRLYDQARQSSEAKSTFLNMAAHELRTPISVLIGYLSLLSDGTLGPGPPDWVKPLEILSTKAAELNRIVDHLLTAARMETEDVDARQTPLDLRTVVGQAVTRARPRAELLSGRISLEAGARPLPILADPGHLGRILDNLIDNGLSYSADPPRLTITLGDENHHGVVRVADKGIGIPEDAWERVFERFYRHHDPFFTASGTGLGLFISRRLAEAQGGSLTVERSQPGQGSVFALAIPIAADAPPAASVGQASLARRSGRTGSRTARSVTHPAKGGAVARVSD